MLPQLLHGEEFHVSQIGMTQAAARTPENYSDDAQLIVFSDLDGTLLDHETYAFDAALPALQKLNDHGVPVILTSSKTSAEIARLQKSVGLRWPAIAENGAGVFIPDDCLPPELDIAKLNMGVRSYRTIRIQLDVLEPELRDLFRGFGDMSVTDIAAETGLSLKDSALARRRQWSEPGKWLGSEQELASFRSALGQFGLVAVQGGRFLTISSAPGKHALMMRVKQCYEEIMSRSDERSCSLVSLALGDAPNDIAMLQAADIGVVIPGVRANEMQEIAGQAQGAIWYADAAGPEGWNASVLKALEMFPAYRN